MPMRPLSSGENPTDKTRGDTGVAGNERLTALTGSVLLVLFAVEIVTVILLRALMPAHFFVGVLLIGPVAVKSASTGWRFLRYYSRHPAYRRKGPPGPAMRALAPLLLASTLAVIGSGIALAFTGPAPAVLVRVHVISFLFWLVLIVVHVAAYAARVPKLIRQDWPQRAAPPPPGRWARLAVNIAALVGAGIAAFFLLPTASPWAGWPEQEVSGFGLLAVIVIATTVMVAAARRRRRRLR